MRGTHSNVSIPNLIKYLLNAYFVLGTIPGGWKISVKIKTGKQTIQVLVKLKSNWNSCPSLIGMESDTDTLGKQLGFLRS